VESVDDDLIEKEITAGKQRGEAKIKEKGCSELLKPKGGDPVSRNPEKRSIEVVKSEAQKGATGRNSTKRRSRATRGKASPGHPLLFN